MTLALEPQYARPNRGFAAAIALSIAAHALLLAIHRRPAAPVLSPAAPVPLTLRLRPVPPAVQPPPPLPPETAPLPQPAPRAQRPQRPARTSRGVIAVEPAQRQSDADTYAVKPAPATPEPAEPPTTAPAPRFDLDAARNMARTLANAPDPARAGTPLERLPPPPLQTENKFERAIKGAKRPDCKDGVPGGLLAPLFLAMDKKDSGCKW